ncbi:15500_t:CDS:2, partial [Racocetra fulgida]
MCSTRKRKEYHMKGRELYRKGQIREAMAFLEKSIDITPEMAYKFIQALRDENVEYVVAPYEADAQLAYLEKKNKIAAIITEDSDLLVFGCKTVIYKMDSNGNGIEISRDKFGQVQEINMLGWTDKQFRHMTMLSGCDYLPSIFGIGLKSAYKYVRKFKTAEKVPPDYSYNFKRAELAFLYQRVFDIEKKCLVTLNPIPEDLDINLDTNFIGPYPLFQRSINLITTAYICETMGVDPFFQDLNAFTNENSSNHKHEMNAIIGDIKAGAIEMRENKITPSLIEASLDSPTEVDLDVISEVSDQNQHGTTLKKRRLNELSHNNIAAIDCSESSIHDKKLMIKNGILCFKQSQDQKPYAS